MSKTKIAWTNVTVNPFPGCRKVSPGCLHCYAEKMARRLKAMGKAGYDKVVDEGGWTGETACMGAIFHLPKKPKMVFVNSMGDLFYERNEWIGGIDVAFESMLSWPQHTFQVLTKRPERALEYYRNYSSFWTDRGEKDHLSNAPNIWLGVTAENQEWADKRIPVLLQIPAAVRFVSLEPLLSEINLHVGLCVYHNTERHELRYGPWCVSDGMLDWVIVGPETGPGRRPCSLDWIKSIVDQCHQAQTAVFVKAVPYNNKIVHESQSISTMLGMPMEELQQFPKETT